MHGLRFLKYFGRAKLLLIVGSACMTACGLSSKNEISVNQAGKSQLSKIISVAPIAAKPGETVNVNGENLSEARKLKLSVKLADGTVADVPLEIKNIKSASFVMPEGVGLGMKVVNLLQGQKNVDSFGLIADQTDNSLPILITEPANVCIGISYIDRNGDAQTGTKNCAASASVPTCSADAQIKCIVDGNGFIAASVSTLQAGNIKSGVVIGGVLGSVQESPASCLNDGSGNCVVDGVNYKAAKLSNFDGAKILVGTMIAGVSGNVTLPAAGKVLTGNTYGVSGNGSTGTLTIPAAANVLSTAPAYGDPGAPLTPSLANQGTWNLTNSFPGAGYYSGTTNDPMAATIASGTQIIGVAGSATLKPADCSTNAVTGCVTTATYQSADLTNLSAGNIKSGVTIAGTAGQYPSSSFQLTDSSGADLTTATFNAQIKSSGTFQYFGSDGVRYTGTGDSDISAANIASGAEIFGATGSLSGAVAPDPWNLRVGVTVNGVTGKLKVNCRNRVRTAVYNYDGAIGSIGTSGVNSGTGIDIWDTIDDYNNNVSGLPPSVVTGWGNNTDCGGVEATAGDDNVWKDVTTTSGGAASTCATDAARCTMQDKITGLWWTKPQSNVAWDAAWSNCQTLSYNGQTGWRLPTQKELMDAYGHGIRSAVSASWITQSGLNNWFWSGSSNSSSSSNAWGVNLSNGYTLNTSITCGVNAYVNKSSTNWHVCVH